MKQLMVFLVVIMATATATVWFLSTQVGSQLLTDTFENMGSDDVVDVRDLGTPSPETLVETGQIIIYTLSGVPNSAAAVNVQFNQTGGYPIFNLALDFNGDGEYAAYETKDGWQEEWIVQNVPAYVVASTSNSYQFDIVDTSIYAKRQVLGHGTFSEASVSARWLDNAAANGKRIRMTTRSFEVGTLMGATSPGNGPSVYRGGFGFGVFDFVAQAIGGVTRSVDVDLSYEVPDLTQEPMECAVAATANNIIGLATYYDTETQLPDTPTLVRELARALKFGDDGIDGVLVRNFVSGKNEFMQSHELPIVTREILNPAFEDMADALARGAALELDLALYENAGSQSPHVASHIVTITGASQRNDTYVLRGRDSATPQAEETWLFVPKTDTSSMAQLQYPIWQKGETRVRRLYIQEWVSTEAAIAAGVLSPGTKIRTYPTEMLKIGTDFYPIEQFTLVDGAACGSVYYAKEGTAIGLKSRERRDLTYLSSTRTGACGYGKVSDVPTETVELTWYQAQLLQNTLNRDR